MAVEHRDEPQQDGRRHLTGHDRGGRRGPAHEADRAVRPEDRAVDEDGERRHEAGRRDVEDHLHQRHATEHGERQGDRSDPAQDQEIRGEEDQPQEHRHFLEHDVEGLPAERHLHGRQVGDDPQKADDGEHRALWDERSNRGQVVERPKDADGGCGQDQDRGDDVDLGLEWPASLIVGTQGRVARLGGGGQGSTRDRLIRNSAGRILWVRGDRGRSTSAFGIPKHPGDIGGMCSTLEIAPCLELSDPSVPGRWALESGHGDPDLPFWAQRPLSSSGAAKWAPGLS